jgi:hypothetical protein
VFGDGESLAFLEYRALGGRVREWSLVTRSIDLQESLALIEVGQQMVAALWRVARARYVERPTTVDIFLPPIGPEKLRSATSPARRVAMTMLRTFPPPTT